MVELNILTNPSERNRAEDEVALRSCDSYRWLRNLSKTRVKESDHAVMNDLGIDEVVVEAAKKLFYGKDERLDPEGEWEIAYPKQGKLAVYSDY